MMRCSLLLLPLVLLAVMAWSMLNQHQLSAPGRESIEVVLEGEHYRLDPGKLGALRQASEDYLMGARQQTATALESRVEAGVERLLGQAERRLPDFLDWYYSLAGEYTRLFMAARSGLNFGGDDYLAEKAGEMLFPEEFWAQELELLDIQLSGTVDRAVEQGRDGWLAALQASLQPHRVPAPLPERASDAGHERTRIELDGLLAELIEREQQALHARAATGGVAAGGVAAAPVIWRAVHRRAAAGGRAAAARGAGRAAGRGATAAAGGATLCAPAGPAALGCALVSGAVAWLTVDAALLQLDESLNRNELEEALRASLSELEQSMRGELILAWEERLDAYYGSAEAVIHETLLPVDMIRSG